MKYSFQFKHRPKGLTPRPNASRQGFALVLSLSLMSFVLVLLLSLTLMVSVETTNSTNQLDRLKARENARLGLMVALGNLQKYAGPDQRVTARAEVLPAAIPGTEKWAGVWDASSGDSINPIWLVSGEIPEPGTGPRGESPATLFPETEVTPEVRAEWLTIESADGAAGKFSFWIEDQGVKGRVNLGDESEQMSYLDTDGIQNRKEALLSFPSADLIFPDLEALTGEEADTPLDKSIITSLSTAFTDAQLGIVFDSVLAEATSSNLALIQHRHDFTTSATGILENSLLGGLKTNLTGRTQVELDEILALAENADDSYLKGDFLYHHNIDPETGIPFVKDATANNPDPTGSNINANDELVRTPAVDFFDLRNSTTDPDDGEMQVIRNIMPVISEASFRLGVFHARSDNKNRLRFHADVEFWNPYPFPIRFPSERQDRAFLVMLVPSELGGGVGRNSDPEKLILSVQKMGAGIGRGGSTVSAEIHTNLVDFDERLDETGNDNWIHETVMQSWMEIDNVVLQPGEVYHASTTKGNGLARIQGGYLPGGDRNSSEDYAVDPSSAYRKWYDWKQSEDSKEEPYPELAEDDRIEIDLRMPPGGLTFRIIEWDASMDPGDNKSAAVSPVYEEDNNDWAKPLFELRNIYKIDNPPTLTLTGGEYSREESGDYSIDNFNVAFHFRLDDGLISNANADASNIGLRFDLRQPVWDYDNPAVKEVVVVGGVLPESALAGVDPDPFDAVNQKEIFFNSTDSDFLADNRSDSHSGGYETAILYPRPEGEPISVGSFQNLPLSYETVDYDANGDGSDELVQSKVGMPWGGTLNEAFDKYFFTGAPAQGWTEGQALPIPAEIKSGTTAAQLREANAAGNLLLKGAFNVNSLSGSAWTSMLARTIHDWDYKSSDPTDLKNAILNLSHSTDAAIETYGSLATDASLTDPTPGDITRARLALRYPLRRLNNIKLFNPDTPGDDSLVEFLLDELESYFANNPPFATVAEFVNSGVLDNAIRRSGINGSIPLFSPAYITQANLLEPIAPFLTVRSDTFIVHSVGLQESIGGRVAGKIICEAIVQRLPERVDGDTLRVMEPSTSNGNSFGRRFVIKQITWKGTDT